MSSQFLSSLLMASPVAEGDVTISIKDELISAPYVSLTIGLMKKFGVNVQIDGDMKGTPSFTIHIILMINFHSPGFCATIGCSTGSPYYAVHSIKLRCC